MLLAKFFHGKIPGNNILFILITPLFQIFMMYFRRTLPPPVEISKKALIVLTALRAFTFLRFSRLTATRQMIDSETSAPFPLHYLAIHH
ncbi:hypothetical protein DGI_3309 [Megalodesulfovibrio gigas DSM 1382 = ATCC 19364]|uniref:Uncharacterized protein n=1 Tax=Megalodesulfovibrio gigas (strain ATCC 19364 / DSM 1382 / NCIMB 9332 / VKM B-1759) TaxID=1121448 RepID=T2GEH5_MEGG1|nr:hypothetical protein DGI_3309 [Megalodesulfovibrio gigas DSM 1382 = ATCC 19364]